jgi:sodium/hydrogen antiporter
MDQLNIALVSAALVVIGLGLLSNAIKRSLLSEPLLALAAGVLIGPEVLGLLDLAASGHEHAILEQAARLTLAIGIMGIALRTPLGSMSALWRPVVVLLILGMLGMWLAGSLLAWLVLGLGPLAALLLGAIVTPTDPIVASSIVTGPFAKETLPDRVRSTLSLESGGNDGLAYLLILLPITVLHHAPPAEAALANWLVGTVLIGVVMAVAIGIAIGGLAGLALRRADARGLIGEHSFLSFSIALSLLALGAAKLVGSDGIIAVFVAGIALNLLVDRRRERQEENVQEAIAKLFNLPIFVLLGAALPWQAWLELGWYGLALALLVLLLRRPPVVLLLAPLLRTRLRQPDIVFLGWFGPVGVAAVYYAMLAVRETGIEAVWPAASLIVTASVVAHGMSATPLMRLYARRTQGVAATA